MTFPLASKKRAPLEGRGKSQLIPEQNEKGKVRKGKFLRGGGAVAKPTLANLGVAEFLSMFHVSLVSPSSPALPHPSLPSQQNLQTQSNPQNQNSRPPLPSPMGRTRLRPTSTSANFDFGSCFASGGGPTGWGPSMSRCFPLPPRFRSCFLSWGVFSWNCGQGRGCGPLQIVHLGFSGVMTPTWRPVGPVTCVDQISALLPPPSPFSPDRPSSRDRPSSQTSPKRTI